MIDYIIIAIILIIVVAAGIYVYRAKKSGRKCIGCPDGCSCGTKENRHGSCCCDKTNK